MDLLTILVISAALFGLITGYREVLILVYRESWFWLNFKKWLYWFTNQSGKNKNRDSFHVSNGTAFTIISFAFSYILYSELNLTWYWIPINTVLFWLFKFYIRNIVMHVLIPKWKRNNPYLELFYLIPLIGSFLQKQYDKKQSYKI